MRAKIINKYEVEYEKVGGKRTLSEFHDWVKDVYVWATYIPYREGLEDNAKRLNQVLHSIVKTDNALVPLAHPEKYPEVNIIEVDMPREEGVSYYPKDSYIDVNDSIHYLEFFTIEEMTHDEFNERRGEKPHL